MYVFAYCHSLILMGAGLSTQDFGLESPICRYQLTKYPVRQNMGAVPGPCHGGLYGNIPRLAGYIAVCSSFMGMCSL